MRRLPFIKFSFLNKKKDILFQKPVVMYNRSVFIFLDFYGLKLRLYNGRNFKVFLPTNYCAGFKTGVFHYTRRIGKGSLMHSVKKKK